MTLSLDRPPTDNAFSAPRPRRAIQSATALDWTDYAHSIWRDAGRGTMGVPSRRELLDAAAQQLRRLQELPEDWDGYGGAPVGPTAGQFMRMLLDAFVSDGGATPQLTPSGDRGVQVEWRVGRAWLQFEFGEGGEVSVYARGSRGEQLLDEEKLEPAELVDALVRAKRLLDDMSRKVTHRAPQS